MGYLNATVLSTSPRMLWDNLTAPASSLDLANKQRARLLAAVILGFVPVAGIAIFAGTISSLITGVDAPPPPAAPIVAWILAFIAYFLSRTANYRWGALLIIAIPLLATVGIVATAEGSNTNPTIYFFMSLSILLASLLLTAQATVITGIVAIIAIIIASYERSQTGTIDAGSMSFALIITVTSALVSSIRDQNLNALQASQVELQQQVIETRQARERAEQSDKVKSAFLASMSHELRTPLNAIINFTRYVAKGSMGPVNEQQSQTLGEVVDSAKQLLNLINDVLDMSKIEAGSLNLFIEDNVNVRNILDNLLSTGKILLVEKSVELQAEIPDDLPTIRGDRQRILQILLNIVANACKFTETGTINVSAVQSGDEIVFCIRDTGPGIAPEDQADVFQAFKQTTSGLRQGGGTGLGMPISKSLAEAHGGRLWLESELHKGSSFYVALPIKSALLAPSISA